MNLLIAYPNRTLIHNVLAPLPFLFRQSEPNPLQASKGYGAAEGLRIADCG